MTWSTHSPRGSRACCRPTGRARERPDLIGTVVAVIAAATAISDELAAGDDSTSSRCSRCSLCYLGAVALSSPRGVTGSWLVLLGCGRDVVRHAPQRRHAARSAGAAARRATHASRSSLIAGRRSSRSSPFRCRSRPGPTRAATIRPSRRRRSSIRSRRRSRCATLDPPIDLHRRHDRRRWRPPAAMANCSARQLRRSTVVAEPDTAADRHHARPGHRAGRRVPTSVPRRQPHAGAASRRAGVGRRRRRDRRRADRRAAARTARPGRRGRRSWRTSHRRPATPIEQRRGDPTRRRVDVER